MKAEASEANLKKISNIYNQGSSNGMNIKPLTLMKNLKAADFVLYEQSQEAWICMPA